MGPFRFHLEKVLKIREHQTMLAKHALAAAQLAAGQAREAIEKAKTARTSFEAEWEGRRARRMTAREWATASEQYDRFVQAEQTAAIQQQTALAEVAAKRAFLEEAERSEKALQKLRDQQWEAHRYAELAAEQVDIDEMARTMLGERKGVGRR